MPLSSAENICVSDARPNVDVISSRSSGSLVPILKYGLRWRMFQSPIHLFFDDDTQKVFTAFRGWKYFLRLFASTFVYQTVSSTDNKRRQENYQDDKTFTFIQISPLVQLGQKLVQEDPPLHGQEFWISNLTSKNYEKHPIYL